jgi:hypothetical protein
MADLVSCNIYWESATTTNARLQRGSFSIKEDAMPRYQFLNIETFHLIIAEAKEAAWRLGLDEGPVVDATRDVNFGSHSTILVRDRIYEVLPLLS